MLGYDFSIEYKPGKENIVVDSLTRSFFMAWFKPKVNIISILRKALREDSHKKNIMDLCV